MSESDRAPKVVQAILTSFGDATEFSSEMGVAFRVHDEARELFIEIVQFLKSRIAERGPVDLCALLMAVRELRINTICDMKRKAGLTEGQITLFESEVDKILTEGR